MIVYKCNTCSSITENQIESRTKKEKIPENWISLNINFYENNQPTEKKVKLIQTLNELLHFCSKDCFKSHFFWKDETIKKNKP